MEIAVIRTICYVVEKTKNSPLILLKGFMDALESVKNRASQSRLPPSSKELLLVSEAEYWQLYYEHPNCQYEWNNGLLEEKPMPDFFKHLPLSMVLPLIRRIFNRLSHRADDGR